ncbi:hypothetical protein [Streptomyces sp. NPDC003710]
MSPRRAGGAAGGDEIRAWLDEAWACSEAAVVLRGGEDAGPLAGRRVVAEVFEHDDLAQLRALTTTGESPGDIRRCFGSLTIALPDAEDECAGSVSHQGRTDIARERGRFGDNLEVADPAGPLAFPERLGGTGVETGPGWFRRLHR